MRSTFLEKTIQKMSLNTGYNINSVQRIINIFINKFLHQKRIFYIKENILIGGEGSRCRNICPTIRGNAPMRRDGKWPNLFGTRLVQT